MNKQIFSVRVILAIGAIVLFCYHWIALQFSPLPWFDETYFASMTLRFMETGEFKPAISPLMDHYYPQAKAYGPLYFVLMSAVFKLAGFGIVQMRLPALVFGFLFVWVIGRLLGEAGFSRRSRVLFSVLVLFDPIFLQNIHSGRMDSFALFWVGVGIFILLKAFKRESWVYFLFVGICFGLAILTTPRIAIPLMGPAVAIAWYTFASFSLNRFFHAALVAFSIIGLYSIWIFWGFGGIIPWWNYFFGPPAETLYFKTLADAYVQTKLYIPVFQYPLIVLTIGLLVFTIFKGNLSRSPIFWISLLNVCFFYYWVNDTGIYGIFCLPFIYLVLTSLVESLKNHKNLIAKPLVALVLINVAIFCFKNLTILNAIPIRDHALVEREIAKHIPKGSRVIGDESYYYAVLKNGSDFQYIDRGADLPRRRKYHFDKYHFQYIVVRDPVTDPSQFNYYKQWGKFELVGEINMPPLLFSQGNFAFVRKLTGVQMNNGYKGKIYRR